MTELELQQKITSNGWQILQTISKGTEANIEHKAAAICKIRDGVLDRMWLGYYLKTDGSCYWQDRDPFPAASVPSFTDKVNAKINNLIIDGIIKAGYVEKSNDVSKTALVVTVNTTNDFKVYHVYSDANGAIQVVPLTGTYPIG